MAKINGESIARTLPRGVVAGVLTIATTIDLHVPMGAIAAAVLFAVACIIINILTSYI